MVWHLRGKEGQVGSIPAGGSATTCILSHMRDIYGKGLLREFLNTNSPRTSDVTRVTVAELRKLVKESLDAPMMEADPAASGAVAIPDHYRTAKPLENSGFDAVKLFLSGETLSYDEMDNEVWVPDDIEVLVYAVTGSDSIGSEDRWQATKTVSDLKIVPVKTDYEHTRIDRSELETIQQRVKIALADQTGGY